MKVPFPDLDFAGIRTIPLRSRRNKVRVDDLVGAVSAGMTVAEWMAALPRQLAAADLRAIASDLAAVHRAGGLILVMIGGHVVKVGLGPLLCQMVERGIVGALAMNGAASIHDFELAFCGGTSEDVGENIRTGEFGMAHETGEWMNGALSDDPTRGMGWLLGRLIEEKRLPHRDISVLAAAYRAVIPATVHVAIGTDIIHQHPSADGGRLGAATFADFRRFCGVVARLEGGAVLNFGSAVVMPEVFLKALTVARNLGHRVERFVAADFDMIRHYRPAENVVRRPTNMGGKGYLFTGPHEILIPLLFAALLEEVGAPPADAPATG
jgi:deoxyhypusine synthase